MFKDSIECYQAIGQSLAKAVTQKWQEIEVAVTLDGSRVDTVVSYRSPPSGTISYVAGVPMLARYFHELARLVSSEDKGLYKQCTFKLFPNGHYDANFTY